MVHEEHVKGKVVGIHQPNYFPWCGYFLKIAKSDIFVFLDDVQFTKGGYTNRSKILSPSGVRWMTVPVTVHLGDLIRDVRISQGDWARSHMSLLETCYRSAPCFDPVWRELQEIYRGATHQEISDLNIYLVRGICARLGIEREFRLSSQLNVKGKGDERLIYLMQRVAPGGTYLSGKGGTKYQDPRKFMEAGFGFRYMDFVHPHYDQGREGFQEGLSLLDALFQAGFDAVRKMLMGTSMREHY